jgi:DinB superfamily
MSARNETIPIAHVDPRFPIGRFVRPDTITPGVRRDAVETLAELPTMLRNAVDGLDLPQLNTPYREGGWTVRQLVHHIADSHTVASIRFRLALTEDWPAVAPYDNKAWAILHDVAAPVEWSLELVESLHARWGMLLQSLTDEQWARGYKLPDRGPMTVETATLMYAWHSRHHVAHITHLRAREDW